MIQFSEESSLPTVHCAVQRWSTIPYARFVCRSGFDTLFSYCLFQAEVVVTPFWSEPSTTYFCLSKVSRLHFSSRRSGVLDVIKSDELQAFRGNLTDKEMRYNCYLIHNRLINKIRTLLRYEV